MPDARALATGVAAGRVAIGAALLAAPAAGTRQWVGSAGETPGGGVLARSLGARDLVLGLGAVLALRSGSSAARGWLLAAAAADAADFAGTAIARRDLPSPGATAVAALAGGAAAAGVWLASQLD